MRRLAHLYSYKTYKTHKNTKIIMEENKQTEVNNPTESVRVTETQEEKEERSKLFATCPEKTCKRPYPKRESYPLEVCLACESMGISFVGKEVTA